MYSALVMVCQSAAEALNNFDAAGTINFLMNELFRILYGIVSKKCSVA